jgi:hypothetical protein
VCVYERLRYDGHRHSNSGGGSISWGVRERRSQAAPVRHRHLGGHPARPRGKAASVRLAVTDRGEASLRARPATDLELTIRYGSTWRGRGFPGEVARSPRFGGRCLAAKVHLPNRAQNSLEDRPTNSNFIFFQCHLSLYLPVLLLPPFSRPGQSRCRARRAAPGMAQCPSDDTVRRRWGQSAGDTTVQAVASSQKANRRCVPGLAPAASLAFRSIRAVGSNLSVCC